MFCKHCGCKNDDGSKFCINCGSPLEDVIVKQADTTIVENKFADTKVEDVEIMPEKPVQDVQIPKKNKTWLVVLIVVLIIGLVGFGVYYFVFKDKDNMSVIDLSDNIACNIEVVEGTSSCGIDWDKIKKNYGGRVTYDYDAIKKLADERGLNYDDIKSYFDSTNPIDDLKQNIIFEGGINDNSEVEYYISCKDEALLKLYDFAVILGSGSISLK